MTDREVPPVSVATLNAYAVDDSHCSRADSRLACPDDLSWSCAGVLAILQDDFSVDDY